MMVESGGPHCVAQVYIGSELRVGSSKLVSTGMLLCAESVPSLRRSSVTACK